MANLLQDKDSDLNPGDADYRKRFEGNSGEHDRDTTLSDLQRQEEAGNLEKKFNDSPNSDPVDDARQKSQQGDYANNFTGANNKKIGIKGKKGPIGAIIAIVVVLGTVLGAGFGAVAIEPIWIVQSLVGNNTINTRSTVISKLFDRIMNDKFSSPVTEGVCGTKITILCKLSRPSNAQLKAMEDLGYKAVDVNGKSVRTAGLFPNKRPTYIEYTDSNNVQQKFKATDIVSHMNTDPKFKADMMRSYNPRLASLMDKAVLKVKAADGYNNSDKLKDAPEDKIEETIAKESAGVDVGAKGATTESAMSTIIRKLFGDEIQKMLEKIAQSGKGDAIGLGAGAICVASDVPGMAIKVAHDYQTAQEVKYIALFMAAAGALQAGDGTAAEATGLGNDITSKDSNGKTATDSVALQNDINNTSNPTGASFKKFIPGYSAASVLGPATSVLDSSAKANICRVATNPVTGVSINTALAPETLGIGTAINVALGIAGGFALSGLAGPIADAVVKAIPASVYTQILSSFLGDTTANLVGEASGDAKAASYEQLAGQAANASGLTPMSVSDAVAFEQDSKQVELADAQMDRATHSPLDASNPNTALGSFVGQFMPYFDNMASVTGVMSMLGSLTTNSFTSLINTSVNAADPSLKYQQCPLVGGAIPADTATTQSCSLVYAIPPEYLDNTSDPTVSDPLTVASTLVQSGEVDQYTGQAITPDDAGTQALNAVFGADPGDTSTYANWQTLCTDGSWDNIDDCKATTKKQAAYSLYMETSYVQPGIDMEDTTLTGSSSGSDSSDTTTADADTSLFALLDDFSQSQPAYVTPQTTSSVTPASQQLATTVKRLSLYNTLQNGTFGVIA